MEFLSVDNYLYRVLAVSVVSSVQLIIKTMSLDSLQLSGYKFVQVFSLICTMANPSFLPELSSLYSWNKDSSTMLPASEYSAFTGTDFDINFSVLLGHTVLSSDTNETYLTTPLPILPKLSSLYNWNREFSKVLVMQEYLACEKELEANASLSQTCL